MTEDKSIQQGFTQIYNGLMFTGKAITDAEFRLYCLLSYRTFQKNYCYPGRLRLAKEMGASVAKVDRVKKSLEQKGFIKKCRRGQGITNLYILHKPYFYEAEESPVNAQDESSTIRKEYKGKNTKKYNYLENQKSNEISYNNEEPTQRKSPSKSESSNSVILLSMLKRVKESFDEYSPESLEENELSSNTNAAFNGILYYFERYNQICKEEHPRYRRKQLEDCFFGFLNGIWEIEQRNIPVDQTIGEVIERWFYSAKRKDSNYLRLSHFVGKASSIFYNCLFYLYPEEVDTRTNKEDN